MIQGLKPLYNAALRPALKLFVALRIRPSHITILGLLLFGATGWFSSAGRWYTAAGLAVLGGLADGWDGLLARETGQKSTFGAILDSTCDRLTEILWLLGLLHFYVKNPAFGTWAPHLCFLGISGSIMVSYVKARSEGESVECAGGILQRPERVILLLAGLLAGPQAMLWVLAALALLSYLTVVQRLLEAWKRAGKGA
jgi:CDP-diacylglycerol--glycerol-3-phosphate 3-phosphatidyltransferase